MLQERAECGQTLSYGRARIFVDRRLWWRGRQALLLEVHPQQPIELFDIMRYASRLERNGVAGRLRRIGQIGENNLPWGYPSQEREQASGAHWAAAQSVLDQTMRKAGNRSRRPHDQAETLCAKGPMAIGHPVGSSREQEHPRRRASNSQQQGQGH
ncbi:MAG TPA: hypothetical protein VMV94_06885 [Phycisphaerae bacterium]|nr:hypothetical protein [Phycisphaerae bacterium]